MAFLDEEEQQAAAPEGPERPRRGLSGPERRRQQYRLRRLIAVGVGVGFLILLVIGARGCLEARSDRGLRNYTQDIGTIMQESEQRGKDFFDTIETSQSSPIDLQNQINSLRGASESLYDRAQKIGVPGQMDDAQDAAILSLRLRRGALDTISQNVGQAAAPRAETADAITAIQEQMGSLYASDILWTQVAAPEINDVLESEQVDGQDLPAGNFMPEDALDWLDQARIAEVFGGLTGTDVASGTHGLGLLETSIGDTTLSADSATTVPDDSREIAVQVQNQGESAEAGVTVVVTLNGSELQDTIDLDAGESGTVKLPIETLPQPGAETTVEVLVQPVPGEAVADNNEATYTVVFGTAAG